jgi:transposase-like protein
MSKPAVKLSKDVYKYALENINVKSIREIAKEIGVDHSYLRKKLKKEACYSEPKTGRKRIDLNIQEILILYKSGLGCQKIARKMGVSTVTISNRISEAVGTLRTMRQVWCMRKNGDSEDAVNELLAKKDCVQRHSAAALRLKELLKDINEY